MRDKQLFHVFLLFAIVTLALGSLAINISSRYDKERVTTLSLRDVSSPSGETLFTVDCNAYARYLRTSVGITYDGERWDLQQISEIQDYLNSKSNNDILSLPSLYLSRSYRDFNRDVLNKLTALDDEVYLGLPENITNRVKELAHNITEGMPTPFEKAKAIETFLRVRYEYKLDYDPAPRGWEANDWFLFESKEGVCDNFNSAFVVLARAAGIPARLAAGYYIPPCEGDSQPVYASQAHAWTEVGFSGLGWLTFEATPP